MFAFSVECQDTERYILQDSGRYAHSAEYLRGVASAADFEEVSLTDGVLHLECGEPVQGYLALFRSGASST